MNKIEKLTLNREIKLLLLQILKNGEIADTQANELMKFCEVNELIKLELILTPEQFEQALEMIKPKNIQ